MILRASLFTFGFFIVGCGARTDLGALLSSGSDGGSGGSGSGGDGGTAPDCDPPIGVERVATFEGVRELAVYDGWIYGTSAQALFRVSVCGGEATKLADNPEGEGSLRGLTVGPFGVHWGSSGPDAHIARADLDGSNQDFHQAANALTVGADRDAGYFLSQSGNLLAHRSTGDALIASVGVIGYFGPMSVRDGWVYIAFGQNSPANGPLMRVATSGNTSEMLLGGQVPDDMEVRDDQVTLALAHGINQIQTFDATTLAFTVLASDQPTPTRLAVGEELVFFVGEDGLRTVPRAGGDVVVRAAEIGARDVAVDERDVYFVTEAGDLFRTSQLP